MSTTNWNALLRKSPQQDPNFRTDMFGNKLHGPSSAVLDAMAEQKLTGGFDTKRRNLCVRCNQYKSANGTCACDE